MAPCGFRVYTRDKTHFSSISRYAAHRESFARAMSDGLSAEAIFPGRRTAGAAGYGLRSATTRPAARLHSRAFPATEPRDRMEPVRSGARYYPSRTTPPPDDPEFRGTPGSAREMAIVVRPVDISCRPRSSCSSATAGTIAAIPAVPSTANAAGPLAIRQPARMNSSGATSPRAAAGRG